MKIEQLRSIGGTGTMLPSVDENTEIFIVKLDANEVEGTDFERLTDKLLDECGAYLLGGVSWSLVSVCPATQQITYLVWGEDESEIITQSSQIKEKSESGADIVSFDFATSIEEIILIDDFHTYFCEREGFPILTHPQRRICLTGNSWMVVRIWGYLPSDYDADVTEPQ